MRKRLKAWAQLAMPTLCLAALSCGPKPQSTRTARADDEATIRAADIAWSRAADARDLEAVVSYYTNDVVVLPPNVPAVVGKDAARELNRTLMAMPGYSVKWEPQQVEVARSGDIGFARGTYVLTTTSPTGSPMVDRGSTSRSGRSKTMAAGRWRWKRSTRIFRPFRYRPLQLQMGDDVLPTQ